MFNINDFLIKFKHVTLPNETKRNILSKSIFKILNIDINIKNISLENNTVYIKTNSFIKNEIFLHKNEILKEVRKQLKNKTPKDIL